MIPIAPPELCSGLTPGSTIKLADLIAKAELKERNSQNTVSRRKGYSHPLPQPCLMVNGLDFYSKHFYQNTCHCAGGKCERCKARECRDRNWRKLERDVP